jgi:hypothetical protein
VRILLQYWSVGSIPQPSARTQGFTYRSNTGHLVSSMVLNIRYKIKRTTYVGRLLNSKCIIHAYIHAYIHTYLGTYVDHSDVLHNKVPVTEHGCYPNLTYIFKLVQHDDTRTKGENSWFFTPCFPTVFDGFRWFSMVSNGFRWSPRSAILFSIQVT